jgi:hypothetical protein
MGIADCGLRNWQAAHFYRIAALRFPSDCLWQAVCLRLSPLRFGSLGRLTRFLRINRMGEGWNRRGSGALLLGVGAERSVHARLGWG